MSDTHRYAPFLIDGVRCDALDGERLTLRNPATGEVVGEAAYGGAADAERALAAAAAAFPEWSRSRVEDRARMLRRTGELIRERREEISEALTLEQGKPFVDSLREIDFTALVFDYYADMAGLRSDDWRPTTRDEMRSLVIRQPAGVVVSMVPWNYPVDLFAWKAAPALAVGCTLVNKPSPVTPLSTALTVDCLVDAGFPPGVVNNVLGTNEELAHTLVTDPRSRVINVTGSIETGRIVLRQAAEGIKRVVLELGGQSPFIVLADADVEEAAAAAAQRSYTNMGQICIAVNRIYVAEEIRAQFTEAFVEIVKGIEPRNGMDEGALFGPMANAAQLPRVQDHVDDALRRGARALVGGGRLTGGELDRGCYFQPTVLVDVPDDAKVMREETFGPVAPVVGFTSTQELLQRVNDTEFGLAAYVYGGDLGQTLQLAERLEYGGVGINVNDITELQAPFGGWKHSGLGRELGVESLSAYLEPKSIRIRLDPLA